MYSYNSLLVLYTPSLGNTNNEPSGSDKPHICHNALQTSLIREQIQRRISSTINTKSKIGYKGTKKNENENILKKAKSLSYIITPGDVD